MPRHATPTGLTDKQARFVAEYLVDGNATRAAMAAGYSERSAMRQGSDLLRAPAVKKALERSRKEQERRTLVRADRNLVAIERLAQKAEAEHDWAPAIRARELIGKHYKSFTDRIEVKDTTPRADRLAAARARLATPTE